MLLTAFPARHCEEQSDEAIQSSALRAQYWIASLALAMTGISHCEKRKRRSNPAFCFAIQYWIASLRSQ
jgi:hypothetical protein